MSSITAVRSFSVTSGGAMWSKTSTNLVSIVFASFDIRGIGDQTESVSERRLEIRVRNREIHVGGSACVGDRRTPSRLIGAQTCISFLRRFGQKIRLRRCRRGMNDAEMV